ncbi:MAG: hypothetical protein FJZ96_15665 [Chloroflexi bacterium]|nr:hypothetical protein [Chloroflexota bacterium]
MKTTIQKTISILGLSLALAIAIAPPVHAQQIYQGDTVPAGTVLEQDVILFGREITIDGDIHGNVLILGNQVVVNGDVDGSLVLVGQNAHISGTVSGTVYALALTLDLAAGSSLDRDLYVVTVSLTSGREAVIGRDLYAIGLDSGLNGRVGRDLHTTIGPIQLYNGLMTLLGFEELTLRLHFDLPQPVAPDEAGGSQTTSPLHGALLKTRRVVEPAPGFDWGGWALDLLRNWAALFVFGLLALWLKPGWLAESGQALRQRPLQTLASGLLVLVIAVNLYMVALVVAALVFAIGLGLNFLGLWMLSLALWLAAYSILVILAVALWFFIAYGVKIITAYTLARWAFDRFTPRQAFWMNTLALLAGTVVYALLRTIPYVGWVVGLVFTALGMGTAWRAWRQGKTASKAGAAGIARPVRKPSRKK